MAAPKTASADPAPAKSPADPAPVKSPSPAKAPTPAPRTMRDLRLATEQRRKTAAGRTDTNPLREGLRLERVPDPACFVLFGATGDLAHRKVIPALYQLWRTNLLPHEFMLIAIGRRPYTDETFQAEIKAALEKYSRVLPLDPQVWSEFARRISYLKGDFNDSTTYVHLTKRLETCDVEHGTAGNRLYYLATHSSAFPDIIGELGRAGLDHETHGGGDRKSVV
jgi:hypothetical protein